MIFDIQRFSIHDGPGIRTVVFFKGCSLSCEWCENPESQSLDRELFYDASRCQFCGSCLKPAGKGAMRVTADGIVPDRSKEVAQEFAGICPTTATRVVGMDLSAQEIFEKVMRDEPFFRRSGGGVTFSGGEPLIQPKLLLECVELFESAKVPIAIETSLAANASALGPLLGREILWMVDVKHVDADKFKNATGGNISFVLENLRRVASQAREVVYRIPLIPRFNDSEDDMSGILAFIDGITPPGEKANRPIHLLPFHNLAAGKFLLLGRKSPYESADRINEDTLDRWCQAGKSLGFEISIGG